jgi:hypothetical protein
MFKLSKTKIAFIAILAVNFIITSCQTVEEFVPTKTDSIKSAKIQAVALSEGFEVGSTSPKTAYDVAPAGSSSGDNVTLQAKSWNLFDALIANSASDVKAGS